MPRFLPPIDALGEGGDNVLGSILNFDFEMAEGIRDDFVENVVEPIYDIIEQLNFPPWDEYKGECADTAHDLYQAGQSLGHFLFVTFRPLAILAWMFMRYLFASITHLTIQFVDLQRSLDPFVLLCEAACVVVLIGLYLLRRFIQRRRYIPRIKQYFKTKRQRALQEYNAFIAKIAETSTFLALVTPHLLYFLFMALIYSNHWGRVFVRVFSLKLPVQSLLTLWVPVMKTIAVISSYHQQTSNRAAEGNTKVKNARQSTRSDKVPSYKPSEFKSTAPAGTRKNVSALVSRYSSNLPSNTNSEKSEKMKQSTSGYSTKPSPGDQASDIIALEEEMTDMIKYWVVYSFLQATIIFASGLPISSWYLSPLFGENGESYSQDLNSGGMSAVLSHFSSFWSMRGIFVNDLIFMALIWALLFTWISRAQQHIRTETKHKTKGADGWKEATSNAPVWYSSSPIDYVYHRIALTMHLTDVASTKVSSWSESMGNKLESFLKLFVTLGYISESTKNTLVRLCKEGTKYIPCFCTMLMPGYFTNLGGAYASLVLAIQCSIDVLNRRKTKMRIKKFQEFEKGSEDRTYEGLHENMIDHLKYYIVLHFLYRTLAFAFWDSVILATPLFRFILFWVPQRLFQLLFLLWLQVSLFNGSRTVYFLIESELVVLGIINPEYTSLANQEIDVDAEKSITARFVKRAISSIPRAEESSSKEETTSAKEAKGAEGQPNGDPQVLESKQ